MKIQMKDGSRGMDHQEDFRACMRRGIACVLVLPILMAAMACTREKEEDARIDPIPVPEAPATPALSVPVREEPQIVTGQQPKTLVPEDQIPTQEDYEEEAAALISAANLDAALDELGREIEVQE